MKFIFIVFRKQKFSGQQFTRVKYGKTYNREVWCSSDVDKLYYGDDKNNITGEIPFQEIVQILHGILRWLWYFENDGGTLKKGGIRF